VGDGESSYESAEERRRQQLVRQQRFHHEVVARLEREARARSLKVRKEGRWGRERKGAPPAHWVDRPTDRPTD